LLKKTLVRHGLSLPHSLQQQQQQQQLSPQSNSLILSSHIRFPSSEFSTDESLVRSASCNQISGIPSLDATMNQQNPLVAFIMLDFKCSSSLHMAPPLIFNFFSFVIEFCGWLWIGL
jgi:hypothetical protein